MKLRLRKFAGIISGIEFLIFAAILVCSGQDVRVPVTDKVTEKLVGYRPDVTDKLELTSERLVVSPTFLGRKEPKTHFFFADSMKRWVDVDAFSLTTRYRHMRAHSGSTIANQQQWQVQFRPRFKFDKGGKYSIAATISTGNGFKSGFNNTGWGTGHGQTNLYVKQLFFDAKPSKQLEVQIGGIAVNLGENSEATAFDADNYLTGERIIIRHPKALYFDEISLTNAYLGDIDHPNIFRRLHRLNEVNYHQFLFRKQASNAVSFSADYTLWSGADIFHQAVKVKPKQFFLTTMLFDTYQRISSQNGFGFNAFAERNLNKHFLVSGGFARLDSHLTLNADRFPPGKRLYASFTCRPSTMLSITPFITHGIGQLPAQSTYRTRMDIVMTWNILETLHKYQIF